MSQSTDAILAFGFDLGEEFEPAEFFGVDLEDGDDFEFDEFLATLAGAIYPAGHAGIDSPEYVAYSAARDAAIAACPVDLLTHCSDECPMYFLALRGSEVKARRGYPEKVGTEEPAPEKIAAMRAFCDEWGFDWDGPAWHLFSYWG